MSHRARIAMTALLCSLAIALPAAAADDAAADDAAAQLESKKAEWVQKYGELRGRHAQLAADLAQAKNDYSRGRSRVRLRGEGRAGIVDEIARLEKEYAEVDREMQDFPETARRAGAFPGWFRDVPAARVEASPARKQNGTLREEQDAVDRNDDGGDTGPSSRSDERATSRDRRRLR